MKTEILADFQTYISVPLYKKRSKYCYLYWFFFLLLTPRFILLVLREKYKHSIRKMALFFAGRLNMISMKNWRMTEKSCPFHFASYDKGKLQGLTENFLSTARSTNYLNYFIIDEMASHQEIDGMPLFVYLIALLCFFQLLFLWFFQRFFPNIL